MLIKVTQREDGRSLRASTEASTGYSLKREPALQPRDPSWELMGRWRIPIRTAAVSFLGFRHNC